jgi:hypothetical protein
MIRHSFTNKHDVRAIKGKHYNRYRPPKRKKVIVFDLDETIGHFHHLQIICKCYADIMKRKLTQNDFDAILDLFPEFFRPGILTIFDFLFNKKKDNHLYKLYIYTNNQCGEEWVKMIVNYIHSKIHPGLFDKIINAFKIKNRIVELKRTSNSKIYSDFIQCTMLPEDAIETCFIDNTYYENMCDSRVYYILPKAYFHSLSKAAMIRRVVSFCPEIERSVNDHLLENHHVASENEVAITKKIMYLVREFFYYPKIPNASNTKKKQNLGARRSRKNVIK